MPIDRFNEAACAVCARAAIGIGYTPHSRYTQKPMWVCDDPTCLQSVIETYDMKQDNFNGIEEFAKREGGASGAEFLQTIGKHDLYDMDEPEWNEFLRRIIAGYRKSLKAGIEGGEAPF